MGSNSCPDPQMHSPGFQYAHCLPQAGMKPPPHRDMYRYNRVVPMFNSDPCIKPNEGDLLCPSDCGYEKRNHLLPPAGMTPTGQREVFRFYANHPAAMPAPQPMGICDNPKYKHLGPCGSMGPITDRLKCPCVNRPSEQMSAPPVYQPSVAQIHGMETYQREGAIAPTPNRMARSSGLNSNMAVFRSPEYHCQNPYYQTNYICRPVYDRKYLDDCPEQNGPPADTYTFL